MFFVYEQIDDFYKAYEAYSGGVRNSLCLLVELKKSTEFDKFLKNSGCSPQLSLSSFIKKPIEVAHHALYIV
jgi:hypothetical protein